MRFKSATHLFFTENVGSTAKRFIHHEDTEDTEKITRFHGGILSEPPTFFSSVLSVLLRCTQHMIRGEAFFRQSNVVPLSVLQIEACVVS